MFFQYFNLITQPGIAKAAIAIINKQGAVEEQLSNTLLEIEQLNLIRLW